jgi:uncharacterized membrane protein
LEGLTRIIHLYEWLYYRCYRYSKKADGKYSANWMLASVYLLMLLTTNLIVVLFLFVFIFPKGAVVSIPEPRWTIGGACAVAAVLQIFFLAHGRRYKRIIRRFSNETAEQQRRGDRLFGWYLVTSVFSVLGMFVLGGALVGLH